MKTKPNGAIGKEPKAVKAHTPDEVDAALKDVQDVLGRALCPFVILKETAEAMRADTYFLNCQKITLGIQEKHLTKEVESTLRTLVPNWKRDKDGFRYEYKGVPVEIDVIKKDWKYFKNQDFLFYRAEEYKIPNPFGEYWEARNTIA